jgi:aspartate aminotransferase
MISNAMKPFLAGSSTIRAMFEEGKRMAKVYGEENVYDFSIDNPGLNPPQEVFDAIDEINHKLDPHYVHSYPSNAGYESTRKAVADDLNERAGGDYFDVDHIIMTCGAGYAINIINKCIFDPGDKLVVFAPYFVEYGNWARNWGADTLVVPANPELKFDPDAEALREILVPEVKAVMLNNPNNPTGKIYSREALDAVADVLREAEEKFGHTIYLICDEPYRELVYDGSDVPFPGDYYKDSLIAYSWSKSLSMPGDRIGYVAVPKFAEGHEELAQALVVAGRVLGGTNAPTIQELIVERCLKERSDLDYYKRNAQDLYRIVHEEAGFECIYPQGAFYMWIKSPVEDEKEFVQAAKEERILIVPGSSFAGPGWVRASFCIANETILRSTESWHNLGKKYGLMK